MNADDPNVQLVELAAEALGPVTDRVVFLGGCATSLLMTDSASRAVRATTDVDVVVEVASKAEYYELQDDLRKLGFREEVGEVICRWRRGELLVDVMPTNQEILGFANRWYVEAIRTATRTVLPSGRSINVVTSPLFIATKIEAFHGRGKGDFATSHDVEDIVTLVDGRVELLDEVATTVEEIRLFITEEIEALIAQPAFVETIPWHLAPDGASQGRVNIIVERLRKLAGS